MQKSRNERRFADATFAVDEQRVVLVPLGDLDMTGAGRRAGGLGFLLETIGLQQMIKHLSKLILLE